MKVIFNVGRERKEFLRNEWNETEFYTTEE